MRRIARWHDRRNEGSSGSAHDRPRYQAHDRAKIRENHAKGQGRLHHDDNGRTGSVHAGAGAAISASAKRPGVDRSHSRSPLSAPQSPSTDFQLACQTSCSLYPPKLEEDALPSVPFGKQRHLSCRSAPPLPPSWPVGAPDMKLWPGLLHRPRPSGQAGLVYFEEEPGRRSAAQAPVLIACGDHWCLSCKPLLLLVTWFTPDQPTTNYQVAFSSPEACETAGDGVGWAFNFRPALRLAEVVPFHASERSGLLRGSIFGTALLTSNTPEPNCHEWLRRRGMRRKRSPARTAPSCMTLFFGSCDGQQHAYIGVCC
jgi:hypothetical protein